MNSIKQALPRVAMHLGHVASRPTIAGATAAAGIGVRNSSNMSIVLTKNAMPPVGPYVRTSLRRPARLYSRGQSWN
ncbi:hypothetical protein PVAG01_10470 [Phlyctema vagabunda]|uniref:Uncharacterized protein n=1 Tax=Phlyctema vagabunda TaxID=108571 RepID=A0ABR4P625_9HELO